MKFSILTLFITFITCAYAAAVSLPADPEGDIIEAIQRRDVESIELDDGRQELRVYEKDTYQGSVIIAADGELQAVDADGNEIPASELDVDDDAGDDDTAVEKRWPIVPALRVVWLLAKQGIQKGSKLYKRIRPFANCVGHQLFIECSTDWANCLDATGLSPTCITASACLGKEGTKCAKMFL